MKLQTLLHGIALSNISDVEITSVTSDSRMVSEGSLFVCIKGKNFDGHDVATQMIEKGAAAIVCEKDLGLKNQVIVKDVITSYSIHYTKLYEGYGIALPSVLITDAAVT